MQILRNHNKFRGHIEEIKQTCEVISREIEIKESSRKEGNKSAIKTF